MTDAAATQPDNRLSFLDQAMFLGLRATGQEAVMQCVWVYEHPVDFDELRRFPESEWRPDAENSRFLGVYCWNILRNTQVNP